MLRREDLRAIALSACALAIALGIWIVAYGIELPPSDPGAPDLGPMLVIVGCALIALALAGLAVTVMAFRIAEPLTKTESLQRRPDIDLSAGVRAAE